MTAIRPNWQVLTKNLARVTGVSSRHAEGLELSGVTAQLLHVKLTDLDAHDYIKSLALTDTASEIHAMDGAALWRVADDHFVILVCVEEGHPFHRGAAHLRRVLPATWGCFFSAANPAEDYEAHHYGPVDA